MAAPKGTLPTDADVENYFGQVQNALKFRGIRAVSGKAGAQALLLLKSFNALEGPKLYDRVHDTEYRLETDRNAYILRGVVDVLARSAQAPDDPSQMEIWDYKGTRNPGLFSDEMKNYRWQMLVYAELYRKRSGVYPAKAILYFLAEIKDANPAKPTPANAMTSIDIVPDEVSIALDEFDKTALAIIAAEQTETWPLPKIAPPENTCAICDIRWSCDLHNKKNEIRLPFDT